MPELPECICFDCETQLMVRREAALLTAQGVRLISAKRARDKYGLGRDYEHPDGSGLCALCTQPADGEPMLKCCGSRDGEACELSWHVRCLEAVCELVGGTAAPPQDGVLPCCTGWPARKTIDPRDHLSVGHTRYRKGLARPGQLPPQAQPPPSRWDVGELGIPHHLSSASAHRQGKRGAGGVRHTPEKNFK